jgi:Putative metal-binding motif
MRELLCVAAWIGALTCGACSVLVDPESLVIKCETAAGVTEQDPCVGEGLHCVAGVCQVCEGEREDCNGVDDDCDGTIDEGHDQDGDGFSWCGGGVPELADCVPNDPEIYPSATAAVVAVEACDGKDNDCDGRVDEAEGCEVATGCAETGCPAGLSCDMETDRCIALRPVGAGCASDAECDRGFCTDTLDFRTGDVSDTRCATACCDDADCEKGAVCVVTEVGVRGCLPTEIAGRGATDDGGSCDEDGDCSSGLCARGTCTARCHGEGTCPEEQSCVLASARSGGPQQWMCGQSEGRGAGGDLCITFDPTSCDSGACFDGGCASPCARTADCPTDLGCAVEDVSLLLPPSVVRMAICSTSLASESLCCTSADCQGQTCKPRATSAGNVMACQAN